MVMQVIREFWIKKFPLWLMVIVGIWALLLGFHGGRLLLTARQLRAYSLDTIDLDSFDFEQVGVQLEHVERDLRMIRIYTQPVLFGCRLAAHLPIVGPYAAQVTPGIDFGVDMLVAGNALYRGFLPMLAVVQGEGGEELSTPELMYQGALDGQPEFMAARSALDKATQSRQQLDAERLPERLAHYLKLLDTHWVQLYQGVVVLGQLSEMMGESEPAHYLLMAQNSDEIRATGGFVTGLGTVQLYHGELVAFELGDSYQVDDLSKRYPSPPAPLRDFMLADYWMPRDGNWSPDFPAAARQMQALYTYSTGVETRGVVAFDQQAIGFILEATGPIQVAGIDQTLSSENIELYLQEAWSPGEGGDLSQAWRASRKDFMKELGSALLNALLQTRDVRTLKNLALGLQQAAQQGHLQIYLHDPGAQALLTALDWDGGLDHGKGDYLLLVDSNIGFNKVDPNIARSIEYEVDLSEPADPKAALAVTYTNLVQKDVECVHQPSFGGGVYQNLQEACYWDYWRIYTPAQTELVGYSTAQVLGEWLLSGEDWPGTVLQAVGENGTTVLSGLLVLPTHTTETVELNYMLPAAIVESDNAGNLTYRIRVGKQAGVDEINVQVRVIPPVGYEAVACETGELLELDESGAWIWSRQIISRHDVCVHFLP
ncbi:MAG: DUF4012 domain-containing protein [Anaerolineales bacterium]|nr:DUF4012 domain-containing protein [Anaerolineales bacterium]